MLECFVVKQGAKCLRNISLWEFHKPFLMRGTYFFLAISTVKKAWERGSRKCFFTCNSRHDILNHFAMSELYEEETEIKLFYDGKMLLIYGGKGRRGDDVVWCRNRLENLPQSSLRNVAKFYLSTPRPPRPPLLVFSTFLPPPSFAKFWIRRCVERYCKIWRV